MDVVLIGKCHFNNRFEIEFLTEALEKENGMEFLSDWDLAYIISTKKL